MLLQVSLIVGSKNFLKVIGPDRDHCEIDCIKIIGSGANE